MALHTRCIEPSPYTRHDATARVGLPARLAWLPARCSRPCFVDREGAAGQGQAVEGVNGALHRLAVWHLDEARTPRTASLAVGHHPDCAVPQMSNNWPLPRHNNVSSGYPLSPGHPVSSITCREGLTTLPGHGQLVDL
jgi:hypothetical protein